MIFFAYVSRVQSQTLDTGLHGGEGQPVLIVNVSDDRNGAAGDDLGEALGRLDVVAGDANDICTRTRQGVDLGEGSIYVGSLGSGHRLDRDWSAATNGNITDVELARLSSLEAHGLNGIRDLRST